MLNLFDTRLRGRVPALAPDGAVVERDGPIVRAHYGTHGAVDHGPLPEAGLDALVARQVEAFARRNEPVVWPVYAHDHGLSECLRAAGFTAGPARAVLVCPIGTDRADLRVYKGLRAAVAPGEELYWLDWHHVGYRFDPARVGGAGPRWPGAVFPDGDYYLYLTRDLRLGTFGHPWEETVCVFGELLTRVGPELTAALGEPIRRSEP